MANATYMWVLVTPKEGARSRIYSFGLTVESRTQREQVAGVFRRKAFQSAELQEYAVEFPIECVTGIKFSAGFANGVAVSAHVEQNLRVAKKVARELVRDNYEVRAFVSVE